MTQQLIIDAETGETQLVEFIPPPVEILDADVEQAVAGDVVLVTYTNTHDDAPASVTFDANGATATVALTDGTAELEVTMPATGDVTVSIDRENVPPLTIRGV